MPSYVLLPASPSDIPHIATIIQSANQSSPLFQALHPSSPDTVPSLVARLEYIMDEDPTSYIMIVKEAMQGEIVGYGVWHFVNGIEMDVEGGGADDEGVGMSALGRRLEDKSRDVRRRVMGEVLRSRESRGFGYISALGTSPSHQKLGVASKIMTWGVERADDKGLSLYVESSDTVAATRLYEKFGFREYERFRVEAGGDGEIVNVCMVRLCDG